MKRQLITITLLVLILCSSALALEKKDYPKPLGIMFVVEYDGSKIIDAWAYPRTESDNTNYDPTSVVFHTEDRSRGPTTEFKNAFQRSPLVGSLFGWVSNKVECQGAGTLEATIKQGNYNANRKVYLNVYYCPGDRQNNIRLVPSTDVIADTPKSNDWMWRMPGLDVPSGTSTFAGSGWVTTDGSEVSGVDMLVLNDLEFSSINFDSSACIQVIGVKTRTPNRLLYSTAKIGDRDSHAAIPTSSKIIDGPNCQKEFYYYVGEADLPYFILEGSTVEKPIIYSLATRKSYELSEPQLPSVAIPLVAGWFELFPENFAKDKVFTLDDLDKGPSGAFEYTFTDMDANPIRSDTTMPRAIDSHTVCGYDLPPELYVGKCESGTCTNLARVISTDFVKSTGLGGKPPLHYRVEWNPTDEGKTELEELGILSTYFDLLCEPKSIITTTTCDMDDLTARGYQAVIEPESPKCEEGKICEKTFSIVDDGPGSPDCKHELPKYCVIGFMNDKGDIIDSTPDPTKALSWLINCEELHQSSGVAKSITASYKPSMSDSAFLFPIKDDKTDAVTSLVSGLIPSSADAEKSLSSDGIQGSYLVGGGMAFGYYPVSKGGVMLLDIYDLTKGPTPPVGPVLAPLIPVAGTECYQIDGSATWRVCKVNDYIDTYGGTLDRLYSGIINNYPVLERGTWASELVLLGLFRGDYKDELLKDQDIYCLHEQPYTDNHCSVFYILKEGTPLDLKGAIDGDKVIVEGPAKRVMTHHVQFGGLLPVLSDEHNPLYGLWSTTIPSGFLSVTLRTKRGHKVGDYPMAVQIKGPVTQFVTDILSDENMALSSSLEPDRYYINDTINFKYSSQGFHDSASEIVADSRDAPLHSFVYDYTLYANSKIKDSVIVQAEHEKDYNPIAAESASSWYPDISRVFNTLIGFGDEDWMNERLEVYFGASQVCKGTACSLSPYENRLAYVPIDVESSATGDETEGAALVIQPPSKLASGESFRMKFHSMLGVLQGEDDRLTGDPDESAFSATYDGADWKVAFNVDFKKGDKTTTDMSITYPSDAVTISGQKKLPLLFYSMAASSSSHYYPDSTPKELAHLLGPKTHKIFVIDTDAGGISSESMLDEITPASGSSADADILVGGRATDSGNLIEQATLNTEKRVVRAVLADKPPSLFEECSLSQRLGKVWTSKSPTNIMGRLVLDNFVVPADSGNKYIAALSDDMEFVQAEETLTPLAVAKIAKLSKNSVEYLVQNHEDAIVENANLYAAGSLAQASGSSNIASLREELKKLRWKVTACEVTSWFSGESQLFYEFTLANAKN